jgi:hypothetical protein
MAERLMHKHTGEMVTLLAEYEGYYFLTRETDDKAPWSSPATLWERPRPKTGDVWRKRGSRDYRILGVDEVNKTFLYALKDDYADGAWPLPPSPAGQRVEADAEALGYIWVESYTDLSGYELVSRLS